MPKRYKIDEQIFIEDQLSIEALDAAKKIEFIDQRLVEFEATWHILKNAKNDYIKNLKSELLADKAGFVME
jgi:hypothetical protein